MSYSTARRRGVNSDMNKMYLEDRPIHEWYRFVLSFPPHLVNDYLLRFGANEDSMVLDPFCGTGTVLVECKKQGIPSVGVEANVMAHFASKVKVNWTPEPTILLEHGRSIAARANERLSESGIEDVSLFHTPNIDIHMLRNMPSENMNLLLTDSISPLPLHKALVLLECMKQQRDERFYYHELLALAKALVYTSSNLSFGPEVGVGKPKLDAPVISPWLANLSSMATDITSVQNRIHVASTVHHADSRIISQVLQRESIDLVITSPPYPNEKDYTRTTRLESVLLGFINTKTELQALKRGLLRSNTRNVYKGDKDQSESWHPLVTRIAERIEARRIELGKTSGFEKLYATVTLRYFGGIARHLAELRTTLRPGAHLAYVLGDQASYLRVMIPTGLLVADIADSLGYEILAIDTFRTRLATVTKEQLNEEVIVLKWPHTPTGREVFFSGLPLGVAPEKPWRNIMGEQEELTTKGRTSRYQQIMAELFRKHYQPGMMQVPFDRDEIPPIAQELHINIPLNLGDIVYSFRYRQELPQTIRDTAPAGKEWVIHSIGRSQYQFMLRESMPITPNVLLVETRVPDATPGIVTMYAKNDDEQSLLAKIRYNRLVDIFTGVTCYSLQNHLRTFVPNIGQVETDELYVGVDKRGAHYVFPVQAKGGNDRLGIVQIEQDFALCKERFPESAKCVAIAAQFMKDGAIALFAFEKQEDTVKITAEKHYRLVPHTELTESEFLGYRDRLND